MPYTLKEGVEKPVKKEKKKHRLGKALAIIFSILIGIPLLCVGALYACFYDGTHTNISVRQNYQNEKVFNEVLVDTFDPTVSNHKLSVALKEKHLNQILYNVTQQEKFAEARKFIKNLYVNILNGTTTFVIEADAFNIFKTRLFVTTVFSLDEVEEAGEQIDVINFKVTDITLGRIGGMQKTLDFVKKFVNLPDLTEALAASGFHLKIDLNTMNISYKITDLVNDLKTMMGESGSNEFFSLFEEIIAIKELRTIESKEKSMFSVDVDLEKMKVSEETHGIPNYVIPYGYFGSATETIINAIKSFLNNSLIEEEHSNIVAKYMMGGDSILSDSEKPIIQEYKDDGIFSSYSVPYFDYTVAEEDQLNKIIESQIPTVPVSEFDVNVSTGQLDKMLKGSTSTGIISTFIYNNGTDDSIDYKVNYLLTDRLTTYISTVDYGGVTKQTLFVTVSMNLNGYCGNITLACPYQGNPSFGQYEYTMDAMYLGDFEVSDETRATFSKIILSSLNGDGFGGVLTASAETNKIILDFNSVLSGKGISSSMFNLGFGMENSTSNTDGKIILTISPKI